MASQLAFTSITFNTEQRSITGATLKNGVAGQAGVVKNIL